MPRMRDVAAAANVSLTTVSVVLGEVPNSGIPEATQERVRRTAKRLGYIPNVSARSLRTMRSGALGFLANGIAASPFAGEMIRGAQAAAWERGYVLLIVDTGEIERAEETEPAVRILLERRVEKVIVASLFHREVEVPSALRAHRPILVDCYSKDHAYDAIVPDEEGGGYVATRRLLERQLLPVGIIRFPDSMPAGRGRFAGYQRALGEVHLPVDPSLVEITTSGQAPEGYELAARLLDRHPDLHSLFCANDRTAMGAYEAIRVRGLSVPGDIAVVGFDNQEIIATALIPGLTTVALPHYEMGVRAVQRVFESVAQAQDAPPRTETTPCWLVARDSA